MIIIFLHLHELHFFVFSHLFRRFALQIRLISIQTGLKYLLFLGRQLQLLQCWVSSLLSQSLEISWSYYQYSGFKFIFLYSSLDE